MNKRSSKSSVADELAKYAEPVLLQVYRNAVRDTCGVKWVKVAKMHHPQFVALNTWLQQHGINPQQYIQSVVKTWWDWCKDNKMSIVPPSILYGQRAREYYLKRIHASSMVKIDTRAQDIRSEQIYVEVMAAKCYMASNILFMQGKLESSHLLLEDSRRECALMSGYYDDYTAPDSTVIAETLSLLNAQYGTVAKDYDELWQHLLTPGSSD